MRILCIGDIVGRPGRVALSEALPQLRSEHDIDLVVANVENLAHGNGVTEKTLREITPLGIDVFTSGNHIWKNPDGVRLLSDPQWSLLRPQNYPANLPGSGKKVVQLGTKRVLVLNYQGQVFMKDPVENPFTAIDRDLTTEDLSEFAAVIVDFHAEATSEKVAFGWHVDGRVSVVVGTHTHVPTADTRILPGGTGFCSDIGMTGARDSVLGISKELVLQQFRTGGKMRFDVEEGRPYVVHAILSEIDPATRKTTSIKHLTITL